MNNLNISAYGRSNIGKKRGNNEDNFYISGVTVDSATDITAIYESSPKMAVAVFDGIGGMAAGEKASQITANEFGEKLSDIINSNFSEKALSETINVANKKVCNEIKQTGIHMGCTFVSLRFANNKIHIANVGDSRAYLFRNGKLYCVSKDHTVVQTMVDSGLITYEQAQYMAEKHMLTQHIGIFPYEMLIEPYFNAFEAQENDVILLCSDGLTDLLTDNEIQSVLQEQSQPKDAANMLIENALKNGGTDNTTVIVAKVSGNKNKNQNKFADVKAKLKQSIALSIFFAMLLLILIISFSQNKNNDKTTAVDSSYIETIFFNTR